VPLLSEDGAGAAGAGRGASADSAGRSAVSSQATVAFRQQQFFAPRLLSLPPFDFGTDDRQKGNPLPIGSEGKPQRKVALLCGAVRL